MCERQVRLNLVRRHPQSRCHRCASGALLGIAGIGVNLRIADRQGDALMADDGRGGMGTESSIDFSQHQRTTKVVVVSTVLQEKASDCLLCMMPLGNVF